MNKLIDQCPVCVYPLSFHPWEGDSPSDEICPCCGMQFGYYDSTPGGENDRKAIYNEWRQNWINEGVPWRGTQKAPDGWDAHKQLCGEKVATKNRLLLEYAKIKFKNIDRQGIHYTDNQGVSSFIDFEECKKNWINYVNSSDEFSSKKGKLESDQTRCVAVCDINANPPCFEFFTEQRTRFEFRFSLRCLRPKKAFTDLQLAIYNAGWTTYDFS